MTLKSFVIGFASGVMACFLVAIIAAIWEEVAVRWRMKKYLERARKLGGRVE